VTPDEAIAHGLLRGAYEAARELGRGVVGTTAPNPAVGCVVVQDGSIVGRGATSPAGGPHAEVHALAQAGALARGATVVTTLEPCAHTGRTPPCADALIAAGVAEVHVLVRDPNPVAAGGIARLTRAGVRVVHGVEVHRDVTLRARHDLRGWLSIATHGRPHVLLKVAQSLDGSTLPASDGYLTGLPARRHVHALRADVDAVLVGAGTVRADDPRLDVRHQRSERQPRPVVLATTADVAPAARVVARGALIVVGPLAAEARVGELVAAGAEVVTAPQDAGGVLSLPDVLALLVERGIMTILAEPGARLARALLDAELVDEFELHVADAATPNAATGRFVAALPLRGGHFDLVGAQVLGMDRVLRHRRRDGLERVA
jgi:diaminohydroxyphosphoribosylaminopyrimidine deaminase / 5-amino-6-(5-phosphoribosylamino)uracil reductase